MRQTNSNNYELNYVTANRFYVEMESTITASFSECSGLGIKIKKETYLEGGVNDQQRIILGLSEYSDVTLNRFITYDLVFWEWLNKTVGNGNWYWDSSSDNTTLGNGNWHFGDNNTTIGNGNWDFGNNNTVIGNGNRVYTDNSIVIGNGNWSVVVDKSAEIADDLLGELETIAMGVGVKQSADMLVDSVMNKMGEIFQPLTEDFDELALNTYNQQFNSSDSSIDFLISV